jgi:hypothetical protein
MNTTIKVNMCLKLVCDECLLTKHETFIHSILFLVFYPEPFSEKNNHKFPSDITVQKLYN